MKFGADFQHLLQISLLTFERSRSTFKVNCFVYDPPPRWWQDVNVQKYVQYIGRVIYRSGCVRIWFQSLSLLSIFIYSTSSQKKNAAESIRIAALFLDPETGPQRLYKRCCWGSCCYQVFKVLKLFHFTTDCRQTSHIHWWRFSPQSHRFRFSS